MTDMSTFDNHLSRRPAFVRRVTQIFVPLLALMVWATPGAAQLTPIGSNPLLLATGMRGSDVAYDPVHDVYLVVGAYGPVWGAFANANGDLLSFVHINNTGSGFAHYPRVAYSPHVSNGNGGSGGFLVTWHEGTSAMNNFVHTRVVAYPDRLVSPTVAIPTQATHWERGAAVAYSPASQVFMVAVGDVYNQVWIARLNPSGQLLGSPAVISEGGHGARDPGITWIPAMNEFGVIFTGWMSSGATTNYARVSPNGTLLRRNLFNVGGGTYISDIAFNTATNRLVGVWWQNGTQGAEIDLAGDVIASGLVSTGTGTYDSAGLSYNPNSGTFLLVGQGQSDKVWGAELNSRGARTSSDVQLTSAPGSSGGGSFYPRATARGADAQWDLSYSHNFSALRDQVVSTTSRGGGPSGSLGSVSAPPPPTDGGGSTGGCPGTAPFPGAVCVNGGWVPGSGGDDGSGGSTGGCPGTAPFPGAVCVNGGWVPGSGDSGSSGSTGGCLGTAPFPGAVCVNGGWVPGTGDSGSSGSTGGCLGTAPFPGAVCVNGGWVPGSGGGSGSSSGGCLGTAPFPGAVCVNGGWVPGTGDSGSGGSTGGCLGTAPFPGAVCVNGGWVPGTGDSGGSSGGCLGTAPFPGAVCVNGGWVPGTGDSGGSSGGCLGTAPFPGAVCVNGGWVPGTGDSGGCLGTAPFPGAICVNGGWVPGSTEN
jgi:hypothetical protein